MEKKLIVLILLLLIGLKVKSQINLVPNGDFEIYSLLPTNTGQSYRATGWNNVNLNYGGSPYASPDYSNILGFPFPGAIIPYSGSGQMGLCPYLSIIPTYREYISTQLTGLLLIGHHYTVSFSLTNGAFYQNSIATNNFGIHFSKNQLYQAVHEAIPVIPQIKIDTIVYFYNCWHRFSFNYTPTDSSKYITIGVFTDDAYTTIFNYGGINSIGAYYFIDKIEIFPNLSIIGDTTICAGKTITLKMDRDSIVNWECSTNPGVVIAQDSLLMITPFTTSTYYAYNAADTVSFTVKVYNNPIVNLGNDTTLCQGQSLFLNAACPNCTYQWQDYSFASTYNITHQGSYWAKVTSNNNCVASDTINVNYISPPSIDLSKDTILCDGTLFIVNIPNGSYKLKWYDGDTINYHRIFNQSGSYNIVLENQCGTLSKDFELIYNNCDCYIYFPNAFTPDGDGLNEYFCSLFSCKFDSYQLYIYNRWGQLVFESTKPEICWDGKLNNKEVETGVYVWALKYKGPDTKGEQSKHGTVTLIR